MYDFDARRDDVMALFPPVLGAARYQGSDEAAERLRAAEQRLRDGRLSIVVCGEFKRGKSSLLCALLRDVELFPVDVDITTSLVTVVEHGESERIEVLLAGDDGPEIRSISRAEIHDYVTEVGNPGNSRRAETLVVTTPNERLASGRRLVDTPGVGGLNRDHTAVTYAYLPSADVVVFVTDVTQPLTEQELDFVRRVTEHVSVMIFAVTKIDLRPDYDDMVADATAKLAEATGRPGDELRVIPVSSRALLDYLESGDPEDLELSNFPLFEDALWRVLEAEQGQLLLGGALIDLERTAAALLLPLRTELDALQQQDDAARAETKAQLADKQRRLEQLRGSRAEWRRELTESLADLQRDLRYELDGALEQVSRRLDFEYLDDPAMLTEPARLVAVLNQDVALRVSALSERATERAAELRRATEGTAGLALDVPTLAPLQAPPVEVDLEPMSDRKPARSPLEKAAGVFRQTRGTWLGGTMGGIMGFALGGPAGAAWGFAIGATGGYATEVDQVKRAGRSVRRQELARLGARIVREQRREAANQLDTALVGFRRGIEAELKRTIDLEQESLGAALQALATAGRRPADAALRIAELRTQVTALEDVRASVAAVARRITTADEPGAQPARPEGTPPPPRTPPDAAIVDTGSFADE